MIGRELNGRPFSGSPVMSFLKSMRFLAIASVLAATPFTAASGAGLISPFGRESFRLSAADWELLREAVRQVLEAQQDNATATWQGEQSGRAGRATLLRAFKHNGMTCGEVEHAFTAGGGNRYVLPFCRVEDGTWKVAF
jgi:surface antigen